MKHLLTLACMFATALLCAQKIVVFDMEVVLEKHPNTPKDKEQLELTMADYSKERDVLREELMKKDELLRKKAQEMQNPMLAPVKVEELRKECMALQAELENAATAAENQMRRRAQDLSELEKRLIKRTTDEVLAHVNAYAKEKGYDLVLYKNVVPYCADALDITDHVIVLCGGKPDAEAEAKEGASLPPPATYESAAPAVKAPATSKAAKAPAVTPPAPKKTAVPTARPLTTFQ